MEEVGHEGLLPQVPRPVHARQRVQQPSEYVHCCARRCRPTHSNAELTLIHPVHPVDGAYFGTTFPHLFFLTYRELEPPPSTLLYVPRVFGYKIHNKSENRRRLAILAKEDDAAAEEEEKQQVCTHPYLLPSSRIHWGQRPGRHLA